MAHKPLLARERNHRLGPLLGHWPFSAKVTNPGSGVQSRGQAERMSDHTGERQSFVAPLQSLIGVTEVPERCGSVGEGGDPGVLSVDERMRAVLLRVVKRDCLAQLFPGGGQLSEEERRTPQRKVCLDEEARVSRPLRKVEKLLSRLARRAV